MALLAAVCVTVAGGDSVSAGDSLDLDKYQWLRPILTTCLC